jgi:hypothetical protein
MLPTVGVIVAFFICVGALRGTWQLAVTTLVFLTTSSVGLNLFMVNKVLVEYTVTCDGVTVVVGVILIDGTVVVTAGSVVFTTSVVVTIQ